MTRLWRTILTLLTLSAIAPGAPGAARSDEPTDEAARASALDALAKREARAYEFRPDGAGEPFALHPEPVLKWSNPIAGSLYGNVFLWTARGRPEAVASIHKWYSPFRHLSHEFHSLSLGTFVASRDGQPVWSPTRPGVELKNLPEAPAPAATPAQRLRQMRALAGEFTARQTNREGILQELRLLTQPLYRYEKTEGDLVDGALFVFVLGTDPQAFLLLEDRRVDGAPRWRYALARMNNVLIRASRRGREVWSVPELPWSEVNDHSKPYTNYRFDAPEAVERPPGR